MASLQVVINRLMELLAPVNCLGCGIDGAVVCTTCLARLGSDMRPSCFACGVNSPHWRTCERCRRGTELAGVTIGSAYEGVVKDLIWRLKFHRLGSAAEVAAELVMRRAADWPQFTAVTSVPVAGKRYRERGYNQSELIAHAVARRCGLPYRSLLGRVTSTHQIGQDRSARFKQVQGAFYAPKKVAGGRVLLVDDVITTGATLSECAAVLRRAGADEVWAAAVARHLSD